MNGSWDQGWGLTEKKDPWYLMGDRNVLKLDYGGGCPIKDICQAH